MKGTVVYYSNTGSTKIIAERFAEKTGFEVHKLEDKKPRTSPGPVFAGILGLGAALKEPLPEIKDSVFVVLMTPIWAWHPTPQMNFFVRNASLTGKKVFLVGVGAGESNPKALMRFAKGVEKQGGNVVGSKSLKGVQMKQSPKEIEADLQKSADELAEEVRKLAE